MQRNTRLSNRSTARKSPGYVNDYLLESLERRLLLSATITSMNPPYAVVNAPAFTLTVSGSGFTSASQVSWNGTPLTSTYSAANSTVSAVIPGSDVLTTGSAQVTVKTGTSVSNALALPINGPQVVGYLADYSYANGLLNQIDLNALTQLNYFSIVPNNNGTLPSTTENGPSYPLSWLANVVTAAHSATPRVAVNITIDLHTNYDAIAESSSATATLVSALTGPNGLAATYHLDGIDLDYEPDPSNPPTPAQETAFGNLLIALHNATSAQGLRLSVAVQADNDFISPAYFTDIDQFNVMDYQLDYNASAPYSDSIQYMQGWNNNSSPSSYGVPNSKLLMGVPLYGSAGTSWSNSVAETYSQIVTDGGLPNTTSDTEAADGQTWGYNGISTLQKKADYVLQNGYGGMVVWELGQDHFSTPTGPPDQYSLLPAIGAAMLGRINMSYASTSTINLSHDGSGALVDWSIGTQGSTGYQYGQFPVGNLNGMTIADNSGSNTIALSYASGNPLPNMLHINGTSTITGLTGANPLANTTLEIGRSTVYVSYAGSADPLSTIQGYLKNGYNAAKWTGTPTSTTGVITSSPAANNANKNTGIGYSDSADGTGVDTQANTIELKYTLNGDTNLDGSVNIFDLNNLLGHYNQPGVWTGGDSTYDGSVNIFDLNNLLANYNTTLGSQAVPVAAVSAPLMLTPAVAATSTSTFENNLRQTNLMPNLQVKPMKNATTLFGISRTVLPKKQRKE